MTIIIFLEKNVQIPVGRPKDLEKRQRILEAAKHLFLEQGYHGCSMNQIAQAAGVTTLTVDNHFQDKANLFTCAIADTCEHLIQTSPTQLHPDSNFREALYEACLLSMNMVNLPEAIKLDLLLMELAAQQSPLTAQFFNASHLRLNQLWQEFFTRAQQYGFIQPDDPLQQTELITSLLFGNRHQKVLLGMLPVPTATQQQIIIQETIHIFLLRYAPKALNLSVGASDLGVQPEDISDWRKPLMRCLLLLNIVFNNSDWRTSA